MDGLRHPFGASGGPFCINFGSLDGFWLPSTSWKAFGVAFRSQDDLNQGFKVSPRSSPNRTKNDVNMDLFVDAFQSRMFVVFDGN